MKRFKQLKKGGKALQLEANNEINTQEPDNVKL
jgi:hypothetical protein